RGTARTMRHLREILVLVVRIPNHGRLSRGQLLKARVERGGVCRPALTIKRFTGLLCLEIPLHVCLVFADAVRPTEVAGLTHLIKLIEPARATVRVGVASIRPDISYVQ